MTQIFLTSEKFIKDLANIDENLANKYLRSALQEAQEIELREVLGDCLLETLKGMVKENDIPDNYRELIEKCQYVLAYRTISSLCIMSTYKLANVGTVTTRDDNVDNVSWSDLTAVREYYTHKADYFTRLLQHYLLQNKSNFPELKECDCERIKSHLRSSASSGLWLGGARAYKLFPCNF